MLLDVGSRMLAILAVVAFTLVLTGRQIPILPKGRWTFVALFILGFGMCTVAGLRDGLGTTLVPPAWLSAVNGTLGIAAAALLVAVLVGVDWRLGVAGLAAVVGLSWLTTLAYAINAGLPSADLGVVTLVVAAGIIALLAWPTAARSAHPVGSTR